MSCGHHLKLRFLSVYTRFVRTRDLPLPCLVLFYLSIFLKTTLDMKIYCSLKHCIPVAYLTVSLFMKNVIYIVYYLYLRYILRPHKRCQLLFELSCFFLVMKPPLPTFPRLLDPSIVFSKDLAPPPPSSSHQIVYLHKYLQARLFARNVKKNKCCFLLFLLLPTLSSSRSLVFIRSVSWSLLPYTNMTIRLCSN